MLITTLDTAVNASLPRLGEHLVSVGDVTGVTNNQLTMLLYTSDNTSIKYRTEGEQMWWNSDHSTPRGFETNASSGGIIYFGRDTSNIYFGNKYKLNKIVMNASCFNVGDIADLIYNTEAMNHIEIYGNIESDLSVLENCTSLTRITLPKIATGDLSSIENINSIENVGFIGNAFIKGSIEVFSDKSSLKNLELNNTSVEGDISSLGKCIYLTRAIFTGTSVSGDVESLAANMFTNGARSHSTIIVIATGESYTITFTDSSYSVTKNS